jgi:hypothetical protein
MNCCRLWQNGGQWRWLIFLCSVVLLVLVTVATAWADPIDSQIHVTFRGLLAEVIQVRSVAIAPGDKEAVLSRWRPNDGDLVRVDLKSERGWRRARRTSARPTAPEVQVSDQGQKHWEHRVRISPVPDDAPEVVVRLHYLVVPQRWNDQCKVELPPRDAGTEVSVAHGLSRMIGDIAVAQDFLTFRLHRRERSGAGLHGEITTWTRNGHPWGALIIAAPVRQLPPLPSEVLLVLDRSRSINGSLLEREREIAHEVLSQLPARVCFNAVLFDRAPVLLFAEPQPLSSDSLAQLDQQLSPSQQHHGTETKAALVMAGELVRRPGSPRSLLVIVTDENSADGLGQDELAEALGPLPEGSRLMVVRMYRGSGEQASWDGLVRATSGQLIASEAPIGWQGGCCSDRTERSAPEPAQRVVWRGLDSLRVGKELMDVSIVGEGRGEHHVSGLRPGEIHVLKEAGLVGNYRLVARQRSRQFGAAVEAIDAGRWWSLRDRDMLQAGSQLVELERAPKPYRGPDVLSCPAGGVVGSLDQAILTRFAGQVAITGAKACLAQMPAASPATLNFRSTVRADLYIKRGELLRVRVQQKDGLSLPAAALDCLTEAFYAMEAPEADSYALDHASIELALVRTAENPMHIANEVEVISAKVVERFFHGEGAE